MIFSGESPDEVGEDFPCIETFTDCCGRRRRFVVELHTTDGGYFLRAREERDEPGGYEFAAHSETSPYLALGRLRGKIREGLSTRYLGVEDGLRHLSRDRAAGHIGYGSVVIDGVEIPFDEFVGLLQSYEGWQFSLRIVDPYETF